MATELEKAIEQTEREFKVGVRSTVRVQTYNGAKTRNLKVYRSEVGLYVLMGFYRKYRKLLADMKDAHICYFDGRPVVVTYLEFKWASRESSV